MNRWAGCFLVLVFVSFADRLFSAEQVTITYNDGKSEKGELLNQSPEKIVLRVTISGTSADMPISWNRIKSISNGLTQETALKAWKDDNKDKLCPDCGGDRKIACKRCNGGGLLARAMIACPGCKGEGTVACTAKGCDQGQVPCPGKCIKLSEGKWVKGKDDLLWRNFGTIIYSERHVGDVLELQAGQLVDIGKCPICGGSTKVACKVCEGRGTTECALCKGAKQVTEQGLAKTCPDCKGLKTIVCATCKGTGLKP